MKFVENKIRVKIRNLLRNQVTDLTKCSVRRNASFYVWDRVWYRVLSPVRDKISLRRLF